MVKRLESSINALDERYKTSSTIVYIGKSSSCRERDRNVTWEITGNKEYRHSWEDESKTWLFWTRVESMLLSRLHFLRRSGLDENEDEAAKTLKKLLSHNNNSQTWIIFCYANKYVIEDGLIMLDAVSQVDENYGSDKFLGALKERCKQVRDTSPSHAYGCSRLQFYTQTLQGSIKCPECCGSMENYTVLSCCHHH